MSDLTKDHLRQEMKMLRQNISHRFEKEKQINQHLADHPEIQNSKSIAFFWPLKDEINLQEFAKKMHDLGKTLCLPVVIGKNQPMIFRQWQPEDEMEMSFYNIPIPLKNKGEIIPDLIIAPLLCFDTRIYRLGYGGGFYDRTLEKIRNSTQVFTIGVGFDEQEVPEIPIDPFDQKLDCVLTPTRRLK